MLGRHEGPNPKSLDFFFFTDFLVADSIVYSTQVKAVYEMMFVLVSLPVTITNI
jgi:hypothetical protein